MFYRKLISWYFAIKQPILNTRHKCWNQIKSRGWAGGWVGVKNSKFLPLFWKYAYIIQISPPPPGSLVPKPMHMYVLDIFTSYSCINMYYCLYSLIFFQDLKLNNLSGLIPVRALLCSYRCFNSAGHDYYGVAFPWLSWQPWKMKHCLSKGNNSSIPAYQSVSWYILAEIKPVVKHEHSVY